MAGDPFDALMQRLEASARPPKGLIRALGHVYVDHFLTRDEIVDALRGAYYALRDAACSPSVSRPYQSVRSGVAFGPRAPSHAAVRLVDVENALQRVLERFFAEETR